MKGGLIIHGKKLHAREGGDGRSPRYGRPQYDLWGVTRANVQYWAEGLLDWTAWFDMHPLTATREFPGIPQRRPAAWAWYCKQDGSRPIYLQDPDLASDPVLARQLFNQVPGATVFPLTRLIDLLPAGECPLICQTGMMLLYAALQGYQHVILNGIGVPVHIEHQHLHRDVWHWIGFLRGRGVRVSIEGQSVYHTPAKVYAYDGLMYEELAAARQSLRGPSLADLAEAAERNDREIARGRPRRDR